MELIDIRPAVIAPYGRTADAWLDLGKACLRAAKGRDYEQAVFCFRQAIALGSDEASNWLAPLLAEGKGAVIEHHDQEERGESSVSDADNLRTAP